MKKITTSTTSYSVTCGIACSVLGGAYIHIGLLVGAYVKCMKSMTHDNWTTVQPLFIILVAISGMRALFLSVMMCFITDPVPSPQLSIATTATFVSLLVARHTLGVPDEALIEVGIASFL